MKVIYYNYVTAVSASEENANFPEENLLDTHPRKVWKATSSTATLTATISAGNVCALFNTNARTATVNLKNGATTITSQFFDLSGVLDYYSWLNDLGEPEYSLWFDYGAAYDQGGSHTVEFILDTGNVATILYGGVLFGGRAYETDSGVQYGVKEGLVDYSIRKELSNGSRYYRKRDVVRTFSCSIILQRSTRDFYNFMGRIAQAIGPAPLAWKLTDINNVDWTTFAFFSQPPEASHDFPDHALLSFALTEEV